jgi:CRISPR system Cascade subunit CasE
MSRSVKLWEVEMVVGGSNWDNPYDWHRKLWVLFDGPHEKRTWLFRLDPDALLPGSHLVVLRSPVQPRGAWAKELTIVCTTGEELDFRLRASPTITRVVRDEAGVRRRNGRREPILDDAGQLDWLIRQEDRCGFRVVRAKVGERTHRHFRKNGVDGVVGWVDFTGTLRVVDEELFAKALLEGIGKAKAFGCGMLEVFS